MSLPDDAVFPTVEVWRSLGTNRLVVGWWNIDTGQLVDVPGFDAVTNPERWVPAFVTHDLFPEP